LRCILEFGHYNGILMVRKLCSSLPISIKVTFSKAPICSTWHIKRPLLRSDAENMMFLLMRQCHKSQLKSRGGSIITTIHLD